MQAIKIKQAENYFFYLVMVLNLFPIMSTKFVPTMDGPAHLYNSNIIGNLLFDGKHLIADYFKFNPEPVPNWAGHFFLAIFNFLMPGFVAEKLFLLLYAIGLPWSFRSLIKVISPDNYFLSYIIFPFTYSLFFFLGFYNFIIAFVFMFLALHYWINMQNQLNSFKVITVLFFLLSFTYFSHIMVFGVLLLLMALFTTMQGFTKWLHTSATWREVFIQASGKAGWLLIAAALPLILFYYYFDSRSPTGEIYYLDKMVLLNYIKNFTPLVALDTAREEVFTSRIFYVTAVLLIAALFHKIKSVGLSSDIRIKDKALLFFKQMIKPNDFLLLGALILFVLYFTIADSDGFAGFVSVRFCILFLIILSAWLCVQHYHQWLKVSVIIILLSLNFGLIYSRTSAVFTLIKIADEINKAGNFIEPQSIVLPVKYDDNWFTGHF